MINDLLKWAEAHPVTVELVQWFVLILIAWLSGVFGWIRSKTRTAKVKIVPTASFCFVKETTSPERTGSIAAFVIHATMMNPTSELVVIDKFNLGFQAKGMLRSMRQRLERIAFPARPRKRLGKGEKFMGVFFTEYGDGHDARLTVMAEVGQKQKVGGYLLFVSATWGDWDPIFNEDKVKVVLVSSLTTGQVHRNVVDIRVIRDADVLEQFCPGLLAHIDDASTWNHEISLHE